MKLTVVHQELLSLYERDGRLTPESVVEEATDPANPLHGSFTWDDSEAARKHRLNEARSLIRSVRIYIHTAPEQTRRVRAFTHVAPKQSYVPTERALGEDRDVVLEQCLREIEALRRKYSALVDFDTALRQALEPAAAA